MARSRGKTKWFNNAKGFGFIQGEDGKDVFVHFSKLTSEGYKSLNEGDEVEYDLVTTDKGLAASNVTVVSKSGEENNG